MASYVDQYASLFTEPERMGKDAAILETRKAPMYLASVDPSCFLEYTAAALQTKEPDERTCEYVFTTLTDEFISRRLLSEPPQTTKFKKGREDKPQSLGSNNYKQSAVNKSFASDNGGLDIGSTIRAFTAALKYSKSENSRSTVNFEFCD